MQEPLKLGISTCPNDTFIFDAWVNGRLGSGAPPVACALDDIDTLNRKALAGALDIAKVSFFAYGLLLDRYTLLNAGGALGRGCGPLLIARSADITRESLRDPSVRVVVPGHWTTASLLLALYQPACRPAAAVRFDQIMPALQRGEADAGVIIHEGRFIFARSGLALIQDLGAWWEETTGYPVPLGAIVARKRLGEKRIATIEQTIRRSLMMARSNPEECRAFMRQHAVDMAPDVMQQHVDLYVNDYSFDYGAEGMAAINDLLQRAQQQGLFDRSD